MGERFLKLWSHSLAGGSLTDEPHRKPSAAIKPKSLEALIAIITEAEVFLDSFLSGFPT